MMSLRAVGASVAALIGLCLTAVSPSLASAGVPETVRSGVSPKLAISIDNNTEQLMPGHEVAYTINVHNRSDKDLPNVVVSQLLPTALTRLESDPKPADAEVNQVQWLTKVAAGESALIVMTGKVGDLSLVHKAAGKPKLTTTACVAPDLKSPVTACASESDAVMAAASDSNDSDRIILPAALLGAVCCGGGGYLWYRRRKSQD